MHAYIFVYVVMYIHDKYKLIDIYTMQFETLI